MAHTTQSPSKALHSFTLTNEQVINIAASLASDLDCVDDLMPVDFLLRHHQLLDMFLSRLSVEEKNRALKPIVRSGVIQ